MHTIIPCAQCQVYFPSKYVIMHEPVACHKDTITNTYINNSKNTQQIYVFYHLDKEIAYAHTHKPAFLGTNNCSVCENGVCIICQISWQSQRVEYNGNMCGLIL